MAGLKRTLYLTAVGWALFGIAVTAAPHFMVVTAFHQAPLADYAWIRISGTGSIAFAMLMVMVAHHAEQNWWWSWAFVFVSGVLTVIAVVDAVAGVPPGSSSAFWWGFGAANAVTTASLLWGLARTGTERPPV